MNVLLISEDYLRTNSNLNDNVFGKWILPAIREAQEMGLMPIIGECLYNRVCELVDNGNINKKANIAYKDLLDERIQPYLLYQTLTNIVPLLNGKMGNIGTVATNDEHIVTLSQGELDLTQNYYRERADFYAKRLQEWVKANDLAFPELNCGCGNMKPNLERSNNSVGMWLGGARGKKVRSNDCGCKTDAVRPDCPPCPSYDEGYQSGYTSGHTDGYGEGYDDGYDRGENDGFGEGFESGYTSGQTDGVEVVTTDFRHIDITQNGDYYKVGDYGAYSSITVDVATGSSCQLQQKNYSLTELGAGSWSVQPDEGYDGMSSLTIYDDAGYGESLYQRGQTDGYDSGFTSGYSSGYTSGSTNGYDRGYSSGWSSGYSSGYTSGFTDGASQVGELESITFDVTQDTETIFPHSGYIGMSSVVVNAGDFGDGRYAEGYEDGMESMRVQEVKYDTPTYTEGEPYTVTPDSEYDSMASVELDLSGVHDDAYNEGEENTLSAVMDAAQELTATTNGVWTANTDTGLFSSVTVNVSGSSCALQAKNVEMSATTQTFYPDSPTITRLLGFEEPSWGSLNMIDTGVYPTQTMRVRIKYRGRGVLSDRIIGTIEGVGETTDSDDWRFFDAIEHRCYDIGENRYEDYDGSFTDDGTDYDITMAFNGLYNNIDDEYYFEGMEEELPEGDTICVDIGTIWVQEVIITDEGVEVFHGVPMVSGNTAGLYDTVTDEFFAPDSGATDTAIIETEETSTPAYDGMSAITVNAGALCNDFYQDGYIDGLNDATDLGQEIIIASSVTITEYGKYYFVYDSATSVSAMTVYFQNPTPPIPPTPTGLTGNVITYVSDRNQVEINGTYSSNGNIVSSGCNVYDSFDNRINLISNTYSNGVGYLTFDGNVDRVGKLWYNNPHIIEIDFPNGMRQFKDMVAEYCGLTALTIPSTVEAVGYESFLGNNITEIVFPDSCYFIGPDSFRYNPLTAITFGTGMTGNIGECAFQPCTISVCAHPEWDNTRDSLKVIYAHMTTTVSDLRIPPYNYGPFYLRTGGGTLYVPQGHAADYQGWLNALPSGWTIDDSL